MRTLTLEEMTLVGGGAKTACHANNGWGNGDDNAPGNSLSHNNAENDSGLRSQSTGSQGTKVVAHPTDCGCGGPTTVT